MAKRTVSFTAVDAKDLLGNHGAVADASWSEIWAQWGDAEVQAYFVDAAQWGVLNRSAARALIQGQPPPPAGWSEPVVVLAEYDAHVHRFESDVERGAVPPRVTPVELVRWCAAHRIQLPESFVDAVDAVQPIKGRCEAPGGSEASADHVYPAWIPAGLTSSSTTGSVTRTRGRPAIRNEDYATLKRVGSEILMDAARKGKRLTLEQVAAELKKSPVASSVPVATIIARLKGNLPVQSAKHTVLQVRARSTR